MDIVQDFYDHMADQYDKLFLDWWATAKEQALILERIFRDHGFGKDSRVLDCACGIGTQAIALADLGYDITASDISEGELEEARERAKKKGAGLLFKRADFCALEDAFSEDFDIVIAMDNALPHMLTREDLERAIGSIAGRVRGGGIFVASIRDYDSLLLSKPPCSSPYIHKTEGGQRVSFQTWDWREENYHLTQYILEDEETLSVSKFECEYRAVRREELTDLLLAKGCSEVHWLFPEDTGFYQPIVVARK